MMTDEIARLVTDDGFISEFWKAFAESKPGTTQEDVYYMLNEKYRSFFGEDRFKSFDAFRKRRDRRKPKL